MPWPRAARFAFQAVKASSNWLRLISTPWPRAITGSPNNSARPVVRGEAGGALESAFSAATALAVTTSAGSKRNERQWKSFMSTDFLASKFDHPHVADVGI